jgi:putative membrane protein
MKLLHELGAFAMCLALAACAETAEDDAEEAGSDTAAAVAPANQPAQPVPSDAEIAHIAKTANDADIDGGNLAKSKGRNSEVKSFANLMIADHMAMNQQSARVAQNTGVTPASNPTSQQMMSDHEAAKQQLQAQSGADFDRAYMAHEVDMHQKVLDALDQTLIPNAQNAELKSVLTQARAKVEAHLNRAKDIQGKLGN